MVHLIVRHLFQYSTFYYLNCSQKEVNFFVLRFKLCDFLPNEMSFFFSLINNFQWAEKNYLRANLFFVQRNFEVQKDYLYKKCCLPKTL